LKPFWRNVVEAKTMEVKRMEAKKTQQVVSTTNIVKEAPALSIRSIRDFVGDIKTELGKITWTSAEELRTYTKIVIGATFALGMGIYFIDLIIQGILNGLAFVIQLVGG
jgi:preprotein translocase subunit SecE